MRTEKHNRLNAVNYAKKWALSRNPDFYNFDLLGGDCTNFISQCIYFDVKNKRLSDIISLRRALFIFPE